MLENILKTCQYVADNTTYAKINHEKQKKQLVECELFFSFPLVLKF